MQGLPLGIPIKIAIIEKVVTAQWTMGRGKRPRFLFFPPLLIVPCALSFFPLPSLPTIQTGLCGGENNKDKR